MHAVTHRLSGIALGFTSIALLGDYSIAAGAVLGGNAPDTLEVPSWNGQKRTSIIPHRTLTHWFPLWLILGAYAWVQRDAVAETFEYYLWGGVLGYVAGAILHILMDAHTPMGVPILAPTSKNRKQLKWL